MYILIIIIPHRIFPEFYKLCRGKKSIHRDKWNTLKMPSRKYNTCFKKMGDRFIYVKNGFGYVCACPRAHAEVEVEHFLGMHQTLTCWLPQRKCNCTQGWICFVL